MIILQHDFYIAEKIDLQNYMFLKFISSKYMNIAMLIDCTLQNVSPERIAPLINSDANSLAENSGKSYAVKVIHKNIANICLQNAISQYFRNWTYCLN